MRKLIYLLAGSAFLLASCGGGNKYVVSGTAEGSYDGEKVYMMERVNRAFVPVDSVLIKDGTFTFEGTQEKPVNRYIAFTDGENDPIYLDFFLENGNIDVKLANDESLSSVTGSPTNDAYQAFKNEFAAAQVKLQEIGSSMAMGSSLTEEQMQAKRAEVESAQNDILNVIKANISKNANNQLGVYLLRSYNYYFDYDQVEQLFAQLPAELQQEESMVALNERIQTAKKAGVGNKFIDLEMLTPDGQPIKLSDYAGKGKVVLVDFWASWCGPCRREMPRLVDAYAKYKDQGFEIVGVSFDRDGDAWRKGIKDLNITWPQMSDLKYWESEGAKVYAVRSIPHVILLDGEGTIIASGLYGEELIQKVDEVMAKK